MRTMTKTAAVLASALLATSFAVSAADNTGSEGNTQRETASGPAERGNATNQERRRNQGDSKTRNRGTSNNGSGSTGTNGTGTGSTGSTGTGTGGSR